MYDGGPPPITSGAENIFIVPGFTNFKLHTPRKDIKYIDIDTYLPGSMFSANDQLDNGPVMLSTATQTSSKELKEDQKQNKKTKKK